MVTPVMHGEFGPYIVTYPTRTHFYFMRPTPEMVKKEDICHSLSFLPRFLGHIKRNYSVLAHSHEVAIEVYKRTGSNEAWICSVLHDGEEAYTGDLPTPIKKEIELFRTIGDRIKACILLRFGLTEAYLKWEPIIKEVDDRMLHTESIQLSHGATWEDTSRVLPIELEQYSEPMAIQLLEKALRCPMNPFSDMRGLVEAALHHLKDGGEAARVRDIVLLELKALGH